MPAVPDEPIEGEGRDPQGAGMMGFLVVSAGFREVAAILNEFTAKRMPEIHEAGADWEEALHAKLGQRSTMSTTDVTFQLRVLERQWGRLFENGPSPERAAVDELLSLRNHWAHFEPLSARDVERGIEAMRLLAHKVDAKERLEDAIDLSGPRGLERIDEIETYVEDALGGAPSEAARRAREASDQLRDLMKHRVSMVVEAYEKLPGRVRPVGGAATVVSALRRRDRRRWTDLAIDGPLVASDDGVLVDSGLLAIQMAAVGLRQTLLPGAHEMQTLRLSTALLMIDRPGFVLNAVSFYLQALVHELGRQEDGTENWRVFMVEKAAEAAYGGVPSTLATAGPENTPILRLLPGLFELVNPSAHEQLVDLAKTEPLRVSECLVWWQHKCHQYLGAISPLDVMGRSVERKWFTRAVQAAATTVYDGLEDHGDFTQTVSAEACRVLADVLGSETIDLHAPPAARRP